MSLIPMVAAPLFGAPGLPELLLIAGIVVLVFGASKLPKLGKGLGEGIRNFKSGLKGDEDKKGKELEDGKKSDDGDNG